MEPSGVAGVVRVRAKTNRQLATIHHILPRCLRRLSHGEVPMLTEVSPHPSCRLTSLRLPPDLGSLRLARGVLRSIWTTSCPISPPSRFPNVHQRHLCPCLLLRFLHYDLPRTSRRRRGNEHRRFQVSLDDRYLMVDRRWWHVISAAVSTELYDT